MTTGPVPGWYHAEGDPPNTERYWDGTQWTEGPRPVGGSAPATPPSDSPTDMPYFGSPGPGGQPPGSGLPAPGYGQPAMAGGIGMFPEASKATTALVMSILGLLCCGPLTAVGAYMGRAEQQAIEAGRRDPKNQGMATAAFVIGLIGLVLWGLALVLVVVSVAATG